jgi:hypothetical protein
MGRGLGSAPIGVGSSDLVIWSEGRIVVFRFGHTEAELQRHVVADCRFKRSLASGVPLTAPLYAKLKDKVTVVQGGWLPARTPIKLLNISAFTFFGLAPTWMAVTPKPPEPAPTFPPKTLAPPPSQPPPRELSAADRESLRILELRESVLGLRTQVETLRRQLSTALSELEAKKAQLESERARFEHLLDVAAQERAAIGRECELERSVTRWVFEYMADLDAMYREFLDESRTLGYFSELIRSLQAAHSRVVPGHGGGGGSSSGRGSISSIHMEDFSPPARSVLMSLMSFVVRRVVLAFG